MRTVEDANIDQNTSDRAETGNSHYKSLSYSIKNDFRRLEFTREIPHCPVYNQFFSQSKPLWSCEPGSFNTRHQCQQRQYLPKQQLLPRIFLGVHLPVVVVSVLRDGGARDEMKD